MPAPGHPVATPTADTKGRWNGQFSQCAWLQWEALNQRAEVQKKCHVHCQKQQVLGRVAIGQAPPAYS